LATLAIGTGRVAPGPFTTPTPLMAAAETPSAGHEIAASSFCRGVAVPALGVNAPAGEVAWGRDGAGAEGDAVTFTTVKPARQASTASSARIPLDRR
jgi:hypothetical protein